MDVVKCYHNFERLRIASVDVIKYNWMTTGYNFLIGYK